MVLIRSENGFEESEGGFNRLVRSVDAVSVSLLGSIGAAEGTWRDGSIPPSSSSDFLRIIGVCEGIMD